MNIIIFNIIIDLLNLIAVRFLFNSAGCFSNFSGLFSQFFPFFVILSSIFQIFKTFQCFKLQGRIDLRDFFIIIIINGISQKKEKKKKQKKKQKYSQNVEVTCYCISFTHFVLHCLPKIYLGNFETLHILDNWQKIMMNLK